MSTAQPKIEIRGLYKSFGTKHVLRGLDLDIPAGRSLVVIGGSGTGKSVLIKCILGIVEADKGSTSTSRPAARWSSSAGRAPGSRS